MEQGADKAGQDPREHGDGHVTRFAVRIAGEALGQKILVHKPHDACAPAPEGTAVRPCVLDFVGVNRADADVSGVRRSASGARHGGASGVRAEACCLHAACSRHSMTSIVTRSDDAIRWRPALVALSTFRGA
ncbi:hypothetical protein GCM10011320_31660 [Neoroseomonas lacus]|uniref:Uncharacterized protein n=1 Tax=Neoroseomonas lacus TaxID=287609 RepID=A0A917KQS8_9PROT|nr:hypothetical protein GCM10011320_31660 [Neoroseomonas lacus]